MSIRNSYEGMDWVDALKGRRNKRDYQTRYANTPEDETLDDALEQTAEAVFNVPTKEETSSEAISRMSKDIYDESAVKKARKQIADIKDKLAATEDRPAIDPVELGVRVKVWGAQGMAEKPITKEQWDNISDPRACEDIAKVAAIEFKRQNRLAEWQTTNQNRKHSQSFNPETDRAGKIASSPGQDDHAPRFGQVPANANSIYDPDRLDRTAKEVNEHDAGVARSKQERGDRSRKAEAERASQTEMSPIAVNQGSKVMHSGGHDSEAFSHRVPRNQISMADNLGDDFDSLDTEAKKARLEALFLAKFDDHGPEIKAAADERRSSIQRQKASKEDQQKEWDKLEKPTSTGDIQRRLVELWMPESPEK